MVDMQNSDLIGLLAEHEEHGVNEVNKLGDHVVVEHAHDVHGLLRPIAVVGKSGQREKGLTLGLKMVFGWFRSGTHLKSSSRSP